jgi:hypothetical protein
LAPHRQLIDWLHTFQPDAKLRRLILDTIREHTINLPGEDAGRRSQLLTQLDRLRDLYLMGDLTKPQYVMRRQALASEPHTAERQVPSREGVLYEPRSVGGGPTVCGALRRRGSVWLRRRGGQA